MIIAGVTDVELRKMQSTEEQETPLNYPGNASQKQALGVRCMSKPAALWRRDMQTPMSAHAIPPSHGRVTMVHSSPSPRNGCCTLIAA